MQGPKVECCLLGRLELGLADHLQQGGAGAVQVDTRLAFVVLVQRFAGILFQVRAGQTNAFDLAALGPDVEVATADDGLVELADLVALGQVRIEVALAVETAALCDTALDGEAEQDRHAHRLGVQHRQHSG